MRSTYWDLWLRGVLRILYDLSVLYWRQFAHQFTNDCIIDIRVEDFDTMNQPEHIGSAVVKLEPTKGFITCDLLDESGNDVRRPCSSRIATVSVKVSRIKLPAQDCRLQDAWRIEIKNCDHLPDMDTFSASDPFVEVAIKQ